MTAATAFWTNCSASQNVLLHIADGRRFGGQAAPRLTLSFNKLILKIGS